MNIQSTILKFIVYIIPALSVIYIIIGMKHFKQKRESTVNYFTMLMFACAVYSFGYFLELNCVELNALIFVRKFEFFGTAFIPAFGILFIMQLAEMKLTKKTVAVLFSISTILWLLFITNSMHSLVYRSVDFKVIQGFTVTSTEKGIAFYSIIAYYAFFLIITSIILAKTCRISENKSSFCVMLITFQIPWIAILIVVLGFDTYFDPAPGLIMIICGLIVINEIKNDMFGNRKLLKDAENERKLLLKNIQAGSCLMAISDIESGLFIDVNESFLQTTGYVKDEVIGKNANDINLFYNAEDRTRVLQMVKEKGSVKDIEIKIKVKNGEARIGLFSVSTINIEGTSLLLTSMIDITECMMIQKELKRNSERLALAVSAGSVGIWEWDIINNKLVWDDQMFALYGVSSDVFGGAYDTWLKRLHPDDVEQSNSEIQMALSGGKDFNTEFRAVWEDGTIHNIRGIARVIRDNNGEPVTLVGTNWDITLQKKNESELLFKNAILNAIADATTELMTGGEIYTSISNSINIIGRAINIDRVYFFKNDYDQNNLCFTTSQKAEWNSGADMPQIDNPDLQNIPFGEIPEFIEPLSQNQPFVAIIKDLEQCKTKTLLENQNVLSVIVLPVFVNDEFWGFIGFDECKYERVWTENIVALLATFSNAVSGYVSRNYFENKIEYLSYHDQLTGLFNRTYYEKEIMRLDDEKYYPLTLVMLDVNGLKLTNDAFGHKVGDELLVKISSVLKAECREEDIVARIGGDEFVMLLPETDAENADEIIKRINNAMLKEQIDNIILSVSVGYAVKRDSKEDINEIFTQAEDEMYRHKLSESSSMRSKTIDHILNSLFEKNEREMHHSKRVSEICELIAREMKFSNASINQIRIAGLMHDIGKIGIDEAILNKPQELTKSEWSEIERHSETGYRILSAANEFFKIAGFVLEHHEKWNGEGYPKKLKGKEISIEARIIAVADAYDAMTSDRTYRKDLSKEEAVEEIKRCSGTQFDPEIAKIFTNVIGNYK
jgi:diguanylate cyclase (GGDEF)-like protein/PAS domain S-box-containing protein/putative nucleotidyltransferase with HDIG domain